MRRVERNCRFFERAMLMIDEHTAMEGRHIFDQDNKGWKAVSNAIKGRTYSG